VSSISVLRQSPITCLIHPATYLNKVLLGFRSGNLELWNIRTSTLIHSFTSIEKFFGGVSGVFALCSPPHSLTHSHADVVCSSADAKAEITCMEQSPACDVVCIGFDTGFAEATALIYLHFSITISLSLSSFIRGHIAAEPAPRPGIYAFFVMSRGLFTGVASMPSCSQVLFSFAQKGAVTSATFRTDASAYSGACPYLVTSSGGGSLYVWHLGSSEPSAEASGEDGARTRRLVHVLEDAHGE
jgi:hypothetical protein